MVRGLCFVLGVFVVFGRVGSLGGVPFRWSLLGSVVSASGVGVPAWCRPAVALWLRSSGVSLPVRAVFAWGCGVGVGLPVSSAPLAVWGVRCGGGVVLFAVSGGFGGSSLARLLWRWRAARRRVFALGRAPRGSVLGSLCWLASRPCVLVVSRLGGLRPLSLRFWGARWGA